MDHGSESQSTYARRITGLAREYEASGWLVMADAPGWGRPPPIGGHRPALVAVRGRFVVLVGVSGADAGGDAQTEARHAAFARWASESSKRVFRRVGV